MRYKNLIIILALSIILVTGCNDRGMERLKRYSEIFNFKIPRTPFESPVSPVWIPTD